ncbi:MAG: bifunctional tetrahydrofolate synthase/dihydrofolate synthase [Methylococcaceae bacterium]|nr:bifunctional tetrahydrofolate synthase/dihydrofolate synthase [Methylococcaceae bacterium]
MTRFNTLRAWLDWQESLHPLAIDLGLERVARVYHALNPKRSKPTTITVAGTNGKGSCIAYLEAIYRAEGYRVGAYSSPHILKYNERIKIDGTPVSDECICATFARIENVRGDTSLSYFEFGTLTALDIFRRADVDIQLLEVGLGGRLDAVNIVDPDIALISSIGIDHVDWLGATREAIGREKAGIFRATTPAIIGDLQPPASVVQTAHDKNATLYCINQDFGYNKQADGWEWWAGKHSISNLPEPSLKGEHQYRNASAAILAVKLLEPSLPVADSSIRNGLKNTQLLGRFQLISDKIPLLLDVGHNPEAVKTLVDYLAAHFPDKKIHAIFSMMKDKDISTVLQLMNPVVYDWFFAPLGNPRAATETMMQKLFAECGIRRSHFGFSGFKSAYEAATSQAQSDDLLLVFGSFFLVSDCLNEFENR